MKNKHLHTLPNFVINSFFLIGLISAVAFRSIVIFQRIEALWVRPVWYVGVLGYICFFSYRYMITRKRKHAIKDYQLIEKVRSNACLTEQDREVVMYLLSSIKKSREDVNYLIIFILSLLAILIDLFFVLFL
jgi:hypothetical protein